jgi:hypothetical protein
LGTSGSSASPPGVTDDENAGDRRQGRERRDGPLPAESGRRGATRAIGPLGYLLRAVGAIVVLVAVIVFAVRNMNPVYATRGTLGDELRRHALGAAAGIGAGDSTNVDRLMATDKFQSEKRNFYEDVMRLKQVDSARADSIAQYAVREAYVRGISPAIIFGVMLTENSRFVSKAQSNVGAVGLMQVYPKVWLTKEMTKLFGRDLASDSTNVKYGVFILSHYFNPRTKSGDTKPVDWATALLHYNGCVKGTNTPRCHTYPDKVQGFVEQQATSICGGRTFYDCIAKPFIQGLFKGDRLAPDDSSTRAVVATAAEIAADSLRRTGLAAGDVGAPLPAPIALPPVVVGTPDSTYTAAAALAGASTTRPPTAGAATSAAPGPARNASAAPSAAKKSSAKNSSTKKAPAKKAPAKKAPSKKAPARKTPTQKATVKRTASRRVVAARTAIPAPPKPITIRVP